MRRAVLDALVEAREKGRSVVLATDLEDGSQVLLYPDGDGAAETGPAGGALPVGAALADAARAASREDESRAVEVDGRPVFLRAYNPPARLVVVGAVHTAQPLAAMAERAGFQPVVVDPRRAFATPERFPGVRLVVSWPAEAMEALSPDARTAVVTLTHDPKLDDPALEAALRSEAFYVGALGSRRTHARRTARLEKAGFGPEVVARVHGPVGLDIGARTPGEIAVAILAEVVAARRGALARARA